MSFCCGASMIGTMGTLKHHHTYIYQVPILYCPICHLIEVHSKVKEEYEILADYAHSDQAPEVYFNDYVEPKDVKELFEDCIDIEGKSIIQVLHSQIDNALDLLSIAKKLEDEDWKDQLHHRLKVLSKRLRKNQNRKQQKG